MEPWQIASALEAAHNIAKALGGIGFALGVLALVYVVSN